MHPWFRRVRSSSVRSNVLNKNALLSERTAFSIALSQKNRTWSIISKVDAWTSWLTCFWGLSKNWEMGIANRAILIPGEVSSWPSILPVPLRSTTSKKQKDVFFTAFFTRTHSEFPFFPYKVDVRVINASSWFLDVVDLKRAVEEWRSIPQFPEELWFCWQYFDRLEILLF